MCATSSDKLFKMTALQTSFSVNNVALVNGRPKTLSLKEILSAFRRKVGGGNVFHQLVNRKVGIIEKRNRSIRKFVLPNLVR